MTIIPFLNRVDKLILNPLILLAFAISFVIFIYGVVRFLSVDSGDKGTTRAEARNSILWGIVGMLIMFSVYGIIQFILFSFGISATDVGAGSQYLRL